VARGERTQLPFRAREIYRCPVPFPSPDVHVVILESGKYELTDELVYAGRDEVFTVPVGFCTDLASVPQFLTWLVPVAGLHDRAAIVHDYFCQALEHGTPVVTARDADGIFRRMLRELGVPTVRRWLFFTGVRWGALGTPSRRPGWLADAPAVLIVSALALPVVLPASVVVGSGLVLYGLAEAIAKPVGRVRAQKPAAPVQAV
jgi:hypothetical protein